MFSEIFLNISSFAPFLVLMLIASIVFGIPMFIIAVNLYQDLIAQIRPRSKKEKKPGHDDQNSRLDSGEGFEKQKHQVIKELS